MATDEEVGGDGGCGLVCVAVVGGMGADATAPATLFNLSLSAADIRLNTDPVAVQ